MAAPADAFSASPPAPPGPTDEIRPPRRTRRPPPAPPSIAVIGAGPRGAGFLERLAANARELYGDLPLEVHLIDPHPPGPGRVWRADQSPLLWMNSMAEDVTMFTDDTVRQEGPVRPGPTLAEWAGVDGRTFSARTSQGSYLRWFYERAVAALPPSVTVHEHRTTALRVTGPRDGPQRIRLAGGGPSLTADLVLLTLGHLDAEPDAEQSALAAFADRHGLLHLPPDFTADSDLDRIPAGEPVIVRGLGLAFIDLMVLLTEGRGGRYENGEYVPSGREPVLYAGSRRGVPYRTKIGYDLGGQPPPLPRHFGPEQTAELLRRGPLDFRRDIWPLIDKELGHAHYHRLFHAHPERTSGGGWAAFDERYTAVEPGSPRLRELIAGTVPDPADRLDLLGLDRPLAGRRFASHEALQKELRAHVEADLTRAHDPARSPDLAVFLGLLSVYGQLVRLGDIGNWWHGYFSYLASGPPGPRLRQLLALSRAGVVRFLGPDTAVGTDERRGVFHAAGAGVAGPPVTARTLVEARLPEPSLERSASPLLRALHEGGAAGTPTGLLAVDPADGRILDRTGASHPRRFALGPHTDGRNSGAFTRPRTGGAAFGQNDATARAALTLLRELSARTRPSA
ncbi:adenylate cyclase [Streptomyces inusitatus]|uniref:Adenylate cyclase n=1 Tax=Streptomyces inusitatus TaxID=68221 RepID=A0A918UXJ0_9ACTN|nr:FAD/NAD(P)-binding protein [Streptomyces inusitatus]GGZ41656.1 adenylate cyclase [Streptomyces inusitatus]